MKREESVYVRRDECKKKKKIEHIHDVESLTSIKFAV